MATASAKPSRPGPGTSWLINPYLDLSFFIAAPLAIVPLFQVLAGAVTLYALKLAVLAVSATGHHLPGFIRAYTDKGIFTQFKLRLILAPSLFIGLSVLAAYYQLTLLIFILIVWSTWHGSMQILGFLRIYDVKAGFFSSLTARLDFWMCLTWFVQVVLWSPARKMSVISSFYFAGGPLLSPLWARRFEWAWLALTLAVTAAYLVQAAVNWRRRGYFNLPKLLCMLASFGFWGYCLVGVPNLIVGLILWEIFHDLQYNVFVWNYNRQRVSRDFSQSRLERFLFKMDWQRMALYAACIAAYGCIGLLSRGVLNLDLDQRAYEGLLFQVGNVFGASGLIHFYLDGFIWKVRDGKVQQDLGVQAAGGFQRRTAAHWVYLGLFFAAAGALGVSEYRHLNASANGKETDNLVELIPKSGYANFLKASSLKIAGRRDSAAIYYERAIRYDSNYNFTQAFIADLKYQSGDLEGAIPHFEKAVAQDPGDTLFRENLAALYLQTGRYEKALAGYRSLSALDSSRAAYPYQAAWALLQLKRGLDAKPYLEKTLALDSAQPKAWNYLGMVEQSLGHKERARALYLKSLGLDSTYAHARENLLALGK